MLPRASKSVTPFAADSPTQQDRSTQAEPLPNRNNLPGTSVLASDPGMSSFVRKAAAVLGNELTAVTSVSTDVPGQVSTQAHAGMEPLAERFRQEARKLVDSFIEMLEDRPEQMAQLALPVSGVGALQGDHDQCVPLLKSPPPVHSGRTGCLILTLENSDDTIVECALYTTDIVGSSGHRIPTAQVNVSPCPVRIPPHGAAEVRIEIRVPKGTPAGSYAGLLRVDDGIVEQAVLQLSVAR
jgi:hypothetical protein